MINKRLLLLFLLLVFSASLMTFQSTRGPLRPFAALQIPIYYIDEYLTSTWRGIVSPLLHFYRLEEENKKLKSEIEILRIKESENTELQVENRRLSDLLEMKKIHSDFVVTAQIISLGIRQWPRVFIMDKGSADGIEKDMAVRSAQGLVGKILQVSAEYSKGLFITDANFSASVRLQDSRIEGIISGRGDGLCLLKYVPRDEEIKEGELIITSGLDGLFPEGIPVGHVTEKKKGDELFHHIVVKPVVRTNRLEEVMVLGVPLR
jgi:rod shape-determining protein MreC